MIRNLPIAFVAGAVCVASVAPAAAQPFALTPGFSTDSTKVVTDAHVPLADLDLTSSAGARALLERIEAAADTVCGGAWGAVTEGQQADYRACRAAAISGAVARAHSPLLSALAGRRRMGQRAQR